MNSLNSHKIMSRVKIALTLSIICALMCPFMPGNFIVRAAASCSMSGAAPSAPQSTAPGPPAKVLFDPTAPSVLPAQKIVVKARVVDKDGREVPDGKILSVDVGNGFESYLDAKLNQAKKEITLIGLNPSSGANNRAVVVPLIIKAEKIDTDTVLNVNVGTNTPTAGAIPTASPEVDVMWSVLPKQIIHDNFGGRVADQYFGIGLAIGNNSGFALQIASVGFTVPNLHRPNGQNYTVPTAGYLATRGTITRQQLAGIRTLTMNALNGTAGVLTGFVPFFHALNHKNNYTQFANLFSSPLTSLFNSVVPDLTTGDLNRLDQQALRNDNQNVRTIIENNTQYATIAFFPKHFLDADLQRICLERRATCNDWHRLREDPQTVMQALGDIVLIGQQVQFVNRISLNGRAVTTGNERFTISGRVTETGCSGGVPGVKVKLTGDANFAAQTQTTDASGNYKFDNLPSGGNYVVEPQADSNVTFPNVSSQSVTLSSDMRGMNFEAVLTKYSIKVNVVDPTNLQPVKGVTLKLKKGSDNSETTQTTGDDGTFTFTNLDKGETYTVTPQSSAGFTKFSPTPPPPITLIDNCHLRPPITFYAQK